ncbi:MAG: aminotransferase class III-fold pyridoxal phosphate-dependent enzyme, partial [Actinomycetota bacterium]|nr:aminotransferase class III-fold pyridoxal phosphate-dependent enzyme [Actinomycetota bacterium]
MVATEVPGPRSRAFLARQRRFESNARSYPRRIPIAVARALGSYVEDVDGNRYIDFLTGAGVLGLGHSHPEVVAAVRRQLSVLCHGLDLPTPVRDEFVATQLALLPEEMRSRTRIQFCGPTGENAVDAALKLCKTATGRSEVVSFQGGFHGSTHSTMALSGLVEQKEPVANVMPGVHFFPYPYCFRCPLGLDPETSSTSCLRYLEISLNDPNGGVTRPAAVIVEAVQGEGGVIPAPLEFLRGLRRLTRELDVPLILDEIQSGCGRTGTWFAFEQYGIVPDVVLVSKALGGIGMPIAIVLYDDRLDVWAPGAHTGTFRGNQLAFAAGLAAARIVQRDGVLENVRRQGEAAMARLQE